MSFPLPGIWLEKIFCSLSDSLNPRATNPNPGIGKLASPPPHPMRGCCSKGEGTGASGNARPPHRHRNGAVIPFTEITCSTSDAWSFQQPSYRALYSGMERFSDRSCQVHSF